MTKILIDIERLRYPNSGLGVYCKNLRDGIEIENQGLSISYYGDSKHSSKDKHVKFRHIHSIFNPSTIGFNLVHITHQLDRYFRRTTSIKRVVTLHDLNFLIEDIPLETYKNSLKKVQHNLNQADAIVCISEYVKKHLIDNLRLFNLKKNVLIEVIHNGLQFNTNVDEYPKKWNYFTKQPYILSIGVLHHKKQQHLLIQMLSYLPKEFHLVLVYSDICERYKSVIESVIYKHNLSDRVHFLQGISDAEKRYLFAHCRVYAHPSIAEGFGYPPIEAMAFGKPVILSRFTSLPEIGGKEAYFFDSSDPEDMSRTLLRALSEYESDSNKQSRLIEWANRYDYRIMAKKYLSVYKKLLE